MFDQIFSLIFGKDDTAEAPKDKALVAVAAILVEAASIDGSFDEVERRRIRELMVERFRLDAKTAAQVLDRAVALQQRTSQLFPLTKTVVDTFSPAERVELIETVWDVVYADGKLHEYESNLVRRVAGLLYIPDQDSGAARQRVLARLGLPDQPPA